MTGISPPVGITSKVPITAHQDGDESEPGVQPGEVGQPAAEVAKQQHGGGIHRDEDHGQPQEGPGETERELPEAGGVRGLRRGRSGRQGGLGLAFVKDGQGALQHREAGPGHEDAHPGEQGV
jgi:hypothetical protein